MKVLLEREEIERINQIWVMKNRFEKFFANYSDKTLINSICSKLRDFAIKVKPEEQFEALENFVQEYFKLRGRVVATRNDFIDLIQSDLFKKEKLINRIKLRKELKKAQEFCDAINDFEKEFFERTNISLLRVENERWAREKNEKKEQTIEQ